MLEFFWNNWLLIALAAPFLWAVVALIDVYVVHGIYEDEFDGALIAGWIQLLVWIFVPLGLITFELPSTGSFILLFLSGFLFLFFQFYYFKALFVSNDAALVQILSNLSVLLVPFFAWVIVSEVLSMKNYIGAGLAFLGSILFYLDTGLRKKNFSKIFFLMAISVPMLALSMVFSELGYRLSGADFLSGFLVFCIGGGAASFLLLILDKKGMQKRTSHLWRMSKKYLLFFIFIESLQVAGELTSQRAIDISPAVSYVSVAEMAHPVFILFLSAAIVGFAYVNGKERSPLAVSLYQQQISGVSLKIIATILTATGIYLVA